MRKLLLSTAVSRMLFLHKTRASFSGDERNSDWVRGGQTQRHDIDTCSKYFICRQICHHVRVITIIVNYYVSVMRAFCNHVTVAVAGDSGEGGGDALCE